MEGSSAATSISFVVNGRAVVLTVEPRTHLADALREQLNLTGTHLGCEQGVCGACTVLMDGKPQRSCIAYAVDCDGSEITTIEGFDDEATMAALRGAFSEHHALQCGFCTPGMLITARDIVLRLGEVPERRIREELSGNLCRCTGYVGIVEAVSAVAAGRVPEVVGAKRPVAVREPEPSVRSVTAETVVPPRPVPAGGPVVEERLRLAAAPDVVWATLSDLRRVVACLPGAELESFEGDQVKGRMRVSLGPVRASFSGTGSVVLDASRREGSISGRGRDSGSGSTTEGEVRWQVLPGPDQGSEVVVRVSWRLTGPLAQFGRAGLVQDLVRRLAAEFARNLDAMVGGGAPARATRPLGLLALLWRLIKARLLGR
jgi:carbon-monoxide dehydrogenase small subunit